MICPVRYSETFKGEKNPTYKITLLRGFLLEPRFYNST